MVTIITRGGKVMRALVMIFVCLVLVCPVQAVEIAGVNIAEEIEVDDTTSLVLNGAGIRSKFFFDIYIAQLYLEKPEKESSSIIKDEGNKRIVMHFLYDGVGQDKIVDGWNDGFAANLDEERLTKLQSQIETFNAMFTEEMKSGDIILFDYLPKEGTRVTIKDEVKGVISGKDFNDALLSIWLGEKPVGSGLKNDLLGK